HSSVPSTPNARSAFGKKSSSIARQACPSPGSCRSSSAAFSSAVRSRNAASPSGNSVAVGKSVFRYSSPCRPSSSPSRACAAPPTHSGCQALKTAWWKPGRVISAVSIAPPSESLRSSTHTRRPACARSAAHARPFTPLPTTIASYVPRSDLELMDDGRELVVGDEPALLHPELLDGREHGRLPLLRDGEPELLRLDADRVEAALLAEHDRPGGRDELGRVRLDRRRVVELARDGAALAAVERVAGDRLPRLELVPGQLAHALRDRAHAVEAKVRLDAVERAQRQGDLGEVRIARTLAHSVDRPVHPR